MLQFDPANAPSAPRAASTVIVLRPSADGIEVFCVRRHQKSAFLGGAVVFPGGKVDAQDGSPAWTDPASPLLATPLHARAASMEGPDANAVALAVAACRESLEEAAIVPLERALPDAEILAMRRELESGVDLADTLRKRDVRLAVDALIPWGRWVTPEAEQRRFDARFYLLALPDMQQGAHDERETTQSFWASPEEVLRRFLAGEIFLAPPTCRSVELLAECPTIESAVALAGEQSLLPICPRFVFDEKAPYLALPGDPSHEIPEKRVAGKSRFVLRDARFLSEDP